MRGSAFRAQTVRNIESRNPTFFMKTNFSQLATRSILVLACCLSLFFAHLPAAWACACCANAGTWYERSEPLDDFRLDVLNDIVFVGDANLYLTAAGLETVEGIDSPQTAYELSKSSNGRNWNLRFIGKNGETAGNLSFSLPQEMTDFGADLFDAQFADNRLYKEIRFRGNVVGNGIFSDISNGTQFKLILKGRGNACLSSSEFQHWILQVSGPGVSFSFYGRLNSGVAG